MSWEAWGDNDGLDSEPLLEAGWWDPDKADAVTEAIQRLQAEPIYEDGDKAKGISVCFLQRLTILRDAAGLNVPPAELKEARRAFSANAP